MYIQQCWELLANDVASVCTELNKQECNICISTTQSMVFGVFHFRSRKRFAENRTTRGLEESDRILLLDCSTLIY